MPVTNSVPINTYTANGSVTSFAFTFRIFSLTDIKVYVDGVLQSVGFNVTGVNVSTGGSVVFSVAPLAGKTVRLQRSTVVSRVTDFIEGGPLAAQTLDDDADRFVMMVQDINAIAFKEGSDGKYDAAGKSIKNIGDPVLPNDAVSKSWVETASSSYVNLLDPLVLAAATSADAAALSESNALTYSTNTQTLFNDTQVLKDSAVTAEANSAISEINAATSESNAAIYALTLSASGVWRGVWDSVDTYVVNDLVTYSGSSYRRLIEGTTSTSPAADTVNWQLVVSKGDTGSAGPTGLTGATGAQGFQGDQGIQGEPGYVVNGEGTISGGMTGQVLAKASSTDFDTHWVDQTGAVGNIDGGTADTNFGGTVAIDGGDVNGN